MNILEFRSVSKQYHLGEVVVPALQGIDFTIKKGEFIGILGPSGSGKTTLLNLAGIIDSPTAGSVYFNDKNISQITDNKKAEIRNKEIGYIFQTFNLIPVLSAIENVMLPVQISGMSFSEAKKEAERRLVQVGLNDFLHQRPDKLSGGQRQRVAIARALVCNPLLIIADEPTANLDSDNAYSILEFMRELNKKEQVTFLFSTHDQRLIDIVDRAVLMKDGKITN